MVSSSPKTIIDFKNVRKVYKNGTVGLDNINLQIPKGQFVVVVGLSGAGKSTLLRTINKMHDITDGSLKVGNAEINNYKGAELRKLRRKIGMIFQDFNLVNRASVQKNVLAGRVGYYSTMKTILDLYSKEDKEHAVRALKRVDMAQKMYTRADELSGGQQQRVAIARALMQNPEIILADEPIASLDPKTTKTVMDILKRLNQEDDITVLVNLHSTKLAMDYADRIIGLRDGKLVFDEMTKDIAIEDLNAIYQRGQA